MEKGAAGNLKVGAVVAVDVDESVGFVAVAVAFVGATELVGLGNWKGKLLVDEGGSTKVGTDDSPSLVGSAPCCLSPAPNNGKDVVFVVVVVVVCEPNREPNPGAGFCPLVGAVVVDEDAGFSLIHATHLVFS